MQLIFSVSIIAMVLALLTLETGSLGEGEGRTTDSQIIAEQMYHWHRSTFDRCMSEDCSTGIVFPDEFLSPILHSDERSGVTKFVSRFDESSGVLETKLSDKLESNRKLSFAAISAALNSFDPSQSLQLKERENQSELFPSNSHNADTMRQSQLPASLFSKKSADVNHPMLVSVISN